MKIRVFLKQSIALAILLAAVATANAQGPGWEICGDFGSPPNCNKVPESVDWSIARLAEDTGQDSPLFSVSMGVSGTWTAWGAIPSCNTCPFYFPSLNEPTSGRIGFGSGSIGSVQSGIDDNMQYTFGMPYGPSGTFSYVTLFSGADGTTRNVFGANGFSLEFVGESFRYFYCETTVDNSFQVHLRMDIVGDACRMNWELLNTGGAAQRLGLWFGQWIALKNEQSGQYKGYAALDPSNYPWITIPGQNRPLTETRYIRSKSPDLFPKVVNFAWSQSDSYGFQALNGPVAATSEQGNLQSDATQADEFVIGNQGAFVTGGGLLGGVGATTATMPDRTFAPAGQDVSDVGFLDNPAYIQKYYAQPVSASQKRTIVQYFRSTWSEGSYTAPYAVVVDAPKVLSYDPNGTANLSPNPATVRVWVDNSQGFAQIQQDLYLSDVIVTVDLRSTPGDNNTRQGVTFVGGNAADHTDVVQSRVIQRIDARRMKFLDFQIQDDGNISGSKVITVTVQPTPGPKKTIKATMTVAATPALTLHEGANLVTAPWSFNDTAWTTILGLQQPSDFQAFVWDPVQQAYVVSTSALRAVPTWIVLNEELGVHPLAGSPTLPGDLISGGVQKQLGRGWNLISNPYPYPVYLNQLVGAPTGVNKGLNWTSLVNGGYVSSALAYWDSETQSYKYINGGTAALEPNRGYWVYIRATSMTLKYPEVSLDFANTGRATGESSPNTWTQSEKQWRLMMTARTSTAIDDQNYIGVGQSADSVRVNEMLEPPMGPTQKVGLSIAPETVGDSRMAQALTTSRDKHDWTVLVDAKDDGDVTLTWPNMSTVPRNVRLKITDVASNVTRDMRQSSGYTFTATGGVTRQFKVSMELGGAVRPTIGNVIVTKDGRDNNSPVVITYTLSGSATTSVRILNSTGKEIRWLTRGRADSAGQNETRWDLRDSAGRAVAPGTYRAEIVADIDGQRARRITIINVVR